MEWPKGIAAGASPAHVAFEDASARLGCILTICAANV